MSQGALVVPQAAPENAGLFAKPVPLRGTARQCAQGSGSSNSKCIPCPDGTFTVGDAAKDHDSLEDCLPGGLKPADGNKTTGGGEALPTPAEALLDLEDQLIWALDNTGGRQQGKRTSSRRARACLYDCDAEGGLTTESLILGHVAGSPMEYRSDDASQTFSGKSLVSAAEDQGSCATCVNYALTSVIESTVAAGLHVEARTLDMSREYAYFCQADEKRSCKSGWSFENALEAMRQNPRLFSIQSSCLEGTLKTLAPLPSQLQEACQAAVRKCPGGAAFTCTPYNLAEGIWQIQLWIRQFGAVATRLLVTKAFKDFFEADPTGVYNGTATPMSPGERSYYHAVALIGYNNTGMYWIAQNSWSKTWGDQGLFRITYGSNDIAHPEDTWGVTCTPSQKSSATAIDAWEHPRLLRPDPDKAGCYLYSASLRDSISGIAFWFQVDINSFIIDNVERGVVPLAQVEVEINGTTRFTQQPQLQGPWDGKVLRVCNVTKAVFTEAAVVGNPVWLGPGKYNEADLATAGLMNSDVKSAQVPADTKLVIYAQDNLTGSMLTLLSGTATCLTDSFKKKVVSLEIVRLRPCTYQFQSGDTIYDLSQQMGIELSDLLSVNPQIANPNSIPEGTVIQLPPSACSKEKPIADSCEYAVKQNDTLWLIGQAKGVTVDAILSLNTGINPSALVIGSVLKLPLEACTDSCEYTVKQNDTLWLIGQAKGVTVDAILSLNTGINPNALVIDSVLKLPLEACNSCFYKIKQGDNLWAIGQDKGVPVDAILGLNPGITPEALVVDSSIRLPLEACNPSTCPRGWLPAVGVLFDSWPQNGTEECVAHEGCKYAGMFETVIAGDCSGKSFPCKTFRGKRAQRMPGPDGSRPDCCRWPAEVIQEWNVASTYSKDNSLQGKRLEVAIDPRASNPGASIAGSNGGAIGATVKVEVLDTCSSSGCKRLSGNKKWKMINLEKNPGSKLLNFEFSSNPDFDINSISYPSAVGLRPGAPEQE
eukprot:gene6752-6972_t